MSLVISASRRTDIPAFYPHWFVNRLRAGHVFVQHPYSRTMSRISLEPENMDAIVFWSKNYSPLLSRLEVIEQTTRNLFFHFTITANKDLEFNAPDYQDAIKDYIFLSQRYSPERIVWRYDPICITDKLSIEIHEQRFAQCAEKLKGQARRCIISFLHPYKKVLANLQKYTDHAFLEISGQRKKEYAGRLAQRAEEHGIQLYACCNDYLLSDTIIKSSCIDGRYMSGIFDAPIEARPASTRKECACTRSIDIGAYDTCAHGCIYCYANTDKNKAREAFQRHDPEWNALGGDVDASFVKDDEEQQPMLF